MNQIPIEYWNSEDKKWDSHRAFKTTKHWHVSYNGTGAESESESESCDLMIVECDNGKRYFIEDNWGGDAKGHQEVFNPTQFDSYPTFFNTFDDVNQRTAEIVASNTGADVASLLIRV
ncbi:hypothetical protein [Vibrio sp. 10N.239.312.D08]|uniref:hypothetical protein n=1 Tax=Vibrio sp. 10N.239.312.D08 TaxID=3229978 RepID=UPI00354E297E